MNKQLAGTLIIRNGVRYDYNFKESIDCLLEFCDHVFVGDFGSDDGTVKILREYNDPKLTVIFYPSYFWESIHGKDKLRWATDELIKIAEIEGYEWNFNLQADEIVHEQSYNQIRVAINSMSGNSFLCTRKNLWGSVNTELNVPHNRKPCSTEIVRLAKSYYKSYGDAESLLVDKVNKDFVNKINIWHYGFVRKKEVMKDKIINMQVSVFGMEHYDNKLNESEIFNSELWFKGSDLKPISEPHPKIMQKWILERL